MRRLLTAATLVTAAVGTLAFLARLLPVLRGGGLDGVLAYDDGVYFAAAEALVFGRLPYRDFVLLHPPGIALALAPFAGLARATGDEDSALALARLVFMAVGALNAVLVLRIGWRRLGLGAGLAGGVFYAIWGPALYAERTALLEPLVNLGLLSGLALLGGPPFRSRRRTVAAGVALGLATAVKIWAVVPAVVLLGWVLLRSRPAAVRLVLGGVGGAAVVCLPFFVAAPGRMVRLVLLDQLGRTDNGVPVAHRLTGITEANALARLLPWSAPQLRVALLLAVAAAVVVVVRHRPEGRPWCALLVAQGAVLLASPSYFDHYATYVAPALALVVGAVTPVLLAAIGSARPALRAALLPAALAATVAGTGVLLVAGQLHPEGRPEPDGQVTALARGARCVAADTPETLETADLLVHDLRDGCQVLIDPTGLPYDRYRRALRDGSTVRAREADTPWQHRIARWFARSQAVVLQRRNPDGLSAATLRSLAHEPAVPDGAFEVYVAR